MERVATRGFKKIIPHDLTPLITDFCNKIGTTRTQPNIRLGSAKGRKADIAIDRLISIYENRP